MKVGSTTPWPPTSSSTDAHPPRTFVRVGLGTRFGVPAVTVIAIISLGIVLRIWMMARAGWFIDGDDGVAGIMAAHILRGERPIFLYGQSWMGAFQSYLVAISFSLFGMSRVALKLVTLFEFAAFGLSLYFLARRVAGARVAALSTLLSAIPSVYVLSVTGHLWGPLLDAMTLGTLILLLAIDEAYGTAPPRRPWLRFFTIGLLGGVGFWLHGQTVIYLATAALLLFMRNKRVILQPRILGSAVGFVLGAAPVFIYALHHEFTTFHYYLGIGRERVGPSLGDYQAIATHYVLVNVAQVAGIKVPWRGNPDWLQLAVASIVGGAILALALRRYKGIIGWFRLSLRDGRPEDALLLYAALLSIAFVLSSFGRWVLTFPNIDATGRYAVPLASVLPIMLAIEAVRLADRARPAALLTILVLIGFTLFNYTGSAPNDVWKSPYSGLPQLPASNAELIATLDDLGVDAVWVNQWVGKPLMFDTRERISAADYFTIVEGGDFDRLPAHTERVRTAALPAFVFVTNEPVFGMETWLDERQIPYLKRVAAPFVVLRPLQPVDPAQVVQYMGVDR